MSTPRRRADGGTGRPGPRFQLYRTGSSDVAWRFVASNGRELARSAVTFADEEAARDCLTELLDAGPALAMNASLDASSRWRWGATLDGELVAVSSRSYLRRVESETAMAQFRTLAPGSAVVASVASFQGPEDRYA